MGSGAASVGALGYLGGCQAGYLQRKRILMGLRLLVAIMFNRAALTMRNVAWLRFSSLFFQAILVQVLNRLPNVHLLRSLYWYALSRDELFSECRKGRRHRHVRSFGALDRGLA